MTPSVIQTLKVSRASIWKQDFSIGDANGTLVTVSFLNAMMGEAKVQTQNKLFFLERNAMGAEISVYDGETKEEIAVVESEIAMTKMKNVIRFRYKEDKYTFSRKSIWKNMEFEWRNEAEQELMRLKQQWSWFKSEILIDVNTQLTQGDDVVLLPVLGVLLMYYYKSAQGT